MTALAMFVEKAQDEARQQQNALQPEIERLAKSQQARKLYRNG